MVCPARAKLGGMINVVGNQLLDECHFCDAAKAIKRVKMMMANDVDDMVFEQQKID
jgi:hypothetical protein